MNPQISLPNASWEYSLMKLIVLDFLVQWVWKTFELVELTQSLGKGAGEEEVWYGSVSWLGLAAQRCQFSTQFYHSVIACPWLIQQICFLICQMSYLFL